MPEPEVLSSPCARCPFSRKIEPGFLGGSPVHVYIGQTIGPFIIPCHMTHDSTQLEERLKPDNPACAGAAIFRTHIGVARLMPPALPTLPANHELVFSTMDEFVAHHLEIPIEAARELLSTIPPSSFLHWEFIVGLARTQAGKATFEKVERKDKPNE